jgi:hypothetical protein
MTGAAHLYATLADLLVAFHFCYVLFCIGGEIVIILGGLLRWSWVRNLGFRVAHMAAVALVAAESLAGAWCPLTVWEYQLRLKAGQSIEQQISFIARLVRSLIFYNFPAWAFVVAYVAFAVLVALTLILVPPHRGLRRRRVPPTSRG